LVKDECLRRVSRTRAASPVVRRPGGRRRRFAAVLGDSPPRQRSPMKIQLAEWFGLDSMGSTTRPRGSRAEQLGSHRFDGARPPTTPTS